MSGYDPFDPPRLATTTRRLTGFLLDLVVMTALAVLAFYGAWSFLAGDQPRDAITTLSLVNVIVIGVYQVGFVVATGQTPGKILMRTKVVDAASLEIPSITSALARYALPMAAGFVPILGISLVMLVYGWLTLDNERQGLHDKLATTLVIDSTWRPAAR